LPIPGIEPNSLVSPPATPKDFWISFSIFSSFSLSAFCLSNSLVFNWFKAYCCWRILKLSEATSSSAVLVESWFWSDWRFCSLITSPWAAFSNSASIDFSKFCCCWTILTKSSASFLRWSPKEAAKELWTVLLLAIKSSFLAICLPITSIPCKPVFWFKIAW